MTTGNILFFVIEIIAFLIALTIHEFSHAFVANKLGDPTAKLNGRLTLNPLKHLDPLGLLALFAIRIGWAKPVPINPYNFKNPKKDTALVALAGPFSNFLLALVLVFIAELIANTSSVHLFISPGMHNFLVSLLFSIAFLNVLLAVFNLIPIPPLDGYKLLQLIIPDEWIYKLEALERIGPIFILIAFYLGNLGEVMVNVSMRILDLMKLIL